jgi:hypothetical protein
MATGQEGDTLEVDYSINNTGDLSGDQNVELLIDGTQEDVDNNVQIAGGGSATGTLFWDTVSGDAGTYTAKVQTDDTSDSVSVTVEADSAIPDTGDYQWYINEGEGSTLSSDVGSLSMSVSNVGSTASWVSNSNSVGGAHLSFSDGSDRAETDSAVDISTFSMFGWINPDSFSIEAFAVAGDYDKSATNGVGLEAESAGTVEVITAVENSSSADGTASFVQTGNWGFFGLSYDVNASTEIDLVTYDASTKLQSTSFNAGNSASGTETISIGASSSDSKHVTEPADYDFFGYAEGRTLSESDFDDLWNATNDR